MMGQNESKKLGRLHFQDGNKRSVIKKLKEKSAGKFVHIYRHGSGFRRFPEPGKNILNLWREHFQKTVPPFHLQEPHGSRRDEESQVAGLMAMPDRSLQIGRAAADRGGSCESSL